MRYRFHPKAREQQLDIWIYTCKQWGEKQADQYIDDLHRELDRVAENSSLLRKLPKKIGEQEVKFFRYEHHYIFVKETPPRLAEKLDVLTILHERMDIPRQLQQTLTGLNS